MALDHGANVNFKDKNGKSLLSYIQNSSVGVADLLISRGLVVNFGVYIILSQNFTTNIIKLISPLSNIIQFSVWLSHFLKP